jgi:murein DD-endopeptidase MepM/ murein hydrolase activator NlpD
MQLEQARRAPRRSIERQMARPLSEPRHVTRLSVSRPGRRPAGPGFRQWIGPTALVVLSFLGLVPLAAVGGTVSGTSDGDRGARAASPPAILQPSITTAATPDQAAPAAPVPTSYTPPPRPWAALPGSAAAPDPGREPTSQPGGAPTTAPTSAADFDRRSQVIAIGFPLAANVRYHYRDNYEDYRPGPVEPYNHLFDERHGQLRRAHDGIDIYAALGTPILAPFDGVVIAPASRWQPWQPDRYGITVVIVSTEPATRGYAVLLCHLDGRSVKVGAHVRRGKVVGTLGKSGNAEDADPQLHLELRAPFLIAWTEIGGQRLIDAFNPYFSLRAADPAFAN